MGTRLNTSLLFLVLFSKENFHLSPCLIYLRSIIFSDNSFPLRCTMPKLKRKSENNPSILSFFKRAKSKENEVLYENQDHGKQDNDEALVENITSKEFNDIFVTDLKECEKKFIDNESKFNEESYITNKQECEYQRVVNDMNTNEEYNEEEDCKALV